MFRLDDINSDTDCSEYSDSEYSSEEEEVCVPDNTPRNPFTSVDSSFIEEDVSPDEYISDDDEYIADKEDVPYCEYMDEDEYMSDDEYVNEDKYANDDVPSTTSRDTFVNRTRELNHNEDDELAVAMEISKQQALDRESMRNYQDLDDDEALELALKLSAEAELEERRDLVAQQDIEYQRALEEDRKNESFTEEVETKNEIPEELLETKNEVPEEREENQAPREYKATEFMNNRILANQCPVTISVTSDGKTKREKIKFDMSDSLGLLRKYIIEKYGLKTFDLNFTSDVAKVATITDNSTFEELDLSHTLIRAIQQV